MKTLHIDSYKVPAVDPNRIVHVGGLACPCPRGLVALILQLEVLPPGVIFLNHLD